MARLQESHVKLRADARFDPYTSLALVSLNETNQPSCAVYCEGTGDREVSFDAVIASIRLRDQYLPPVLVH